MGLHKKIIFDKNGKRTTVYVNPAKKSKKDKQGDARANRKKSGVDKKVVPTDWVETYVPEEFTQHNLNMMNKLVDSLVADGMSKKAARKYLNGEEALNDIDDGVSWKILRDSYGRNPKKK